MLSLVDQMCQCHVGFFVLLVSASFTTPVVTGVSCFLAGSLLFHLHHGATGPRQVRGVPEEQLQTPTRPLQ